MYPNKPLSLGVSIDRCLKFQYFLVRLRSALAFGSGQAQKSECRSRNQPRPRLLRSHLSLALAIWEQLSRGLLKATPEEHTLLTNTHCKEEKEKPKHWGVQWSFEWTRCQVGSAIKNLTFIITQRGLCHDYITLRPQSDLLKTFQKFIFMLYGTTALSRGLWDCAR